MKRLTLSVISGLLILYAMGLIVIFANLSIVERHIKRTLLINESLLKRAEFYERTMELLEGLSGGKKREALLVLENLKETLSSCRRCHAEDTVALKTSELAEQGELLLESRADINEGNIFFKKIKNLAEYSFSKARSSMAVYTGELRVATEATRRAILLTVIIGLMVVLAFSFYSLKRVTALERDILSKEKTITDWALQWQETFDAVREMLIILDKEGRPTVFNVPAREFFGDALLRDDFCRSLLGMQCQCPLSKTLRLKDRWLDLRTYLLHENKCIMILRDITEEKEQAERLKIAERLISLGTMAGGIAHEINNPLTAVVGYSELLFGQEADERKKKFLSEILEASRRIQRIVSDLLAFGRRGELRLEEVVIEDFIEHVLRDYEGLTDIRIMKDFHDAGLVRIDKGLFELVIKNLINNAIQAIRDSGKGDRIEIRTSRDNNIIKIEVSDNGPGIPEGVLSRIFDPFFTTKEVGKGSGLGLSIAHNIIIAHRGDISVRTEEGRGTTFTIKLLRAIS